MIFKKLILSSFGTNCYIIGSSKTNEVFILDPGGEADLIIKTIEDLGAKPIAVILTHGHMDHTGKVSNIKRQYKIPLWYAQKEIAQVFSTNKRRRYLRSWRYFFACFRNTRTFTRLYLFVC